MDGDARSCLVEEDGGGGQSLKRPPWLQSRPAPKVNPRPDNCSESFNVGGGKGTGKGGRAGKSNESELMLGQRGGSCEESPLSELNNGLARQNRGNNSNKPYSKIFCQYLPGYSLNLSYSLKNKSGACGHRENVSGGCNGNGNSNRNSSGNYDINSDEIGTLREGTKLAERETKEEESGQVRGRRLIGNGVCKQSPISKSIVSALSKLGISSRRVGLLEDKESERVERESGAEGSPLDHIKGRRQAREESRRSAEFNVERGELASRQRRCQLEREPGQEGLVAGSESSRVKRRGFLYLKAGSSSFSSPLVVASTDLCSPRSSASSAKPLNESGGRRSERDTFGHQKGKRVSSANSARWPDLNNNSIASLLSSGQQNDDGHKTCLIELEQEQEEEEEVESLQAQRREMSRKVRAAADSAVQLGGRMLLQPARCANSTTLALVGYLATLALIALLASCKLALAQLQQQQQPFTRSQAGPAQIAASPLQQSGLPPGGLQTQPALGPGQTPNRPLPQPAAGSLVANINCNKIRGHVTLTPNLQGGTTVSTQISAGPPGEVYQWSVHQFPVKPGAAMCSCSSLILGTKLLDFSEMHGNLPSDQEFNVQSSINLFGSESPVGHSLLLRGMKTGMVACATFLPTSRKSNYRAKFHTPLSGSVTIFQTAFGTSFISHLMYSNGTRRHSLHRFDLVRSEDDIVTTSLLSGSQAGASGSSLAGRIESLALEQREHENELSQCKRFSNGEPLFRNLTYQLSVSTENFGMRGRTSMVLPQIPFETFSSVYVIVYSEYDSSEPIACAPLRFVKPKTAAAKFQSVSVQGSVVFSQDSPYDVTVARVNLNMPNSDGHSYGIDELPMIIRRKSDTRVCPNIREIIYNPHHVEPSSVPPEGEATSDQYAVGDLSGKYGSLTGKASEKIQVNDYNLPLFGPISIVGRAMTIYSAEGVAIACSNVELTTPMTTAFATFDYGIQGQFIFRQPVNDCNGDTYVYIEVSKPVNPSASQSSQQANEASRSLDHNWHIHVNPVDSGLDHLSTTDCLPAGAHFNPYNTSTASIYSRDCTPFNVLRCELGDLSAKMFTIEIPPYRVKGGQEPDIGKFFGTDIDLPLCGPVSIVNRSVVVHVQDFGHQRLACSTVIEFKPRASS